MPGRRSSGGSDPGYNIHEHDRGGGAAQVNAAQLIVVSPARVRAQPDITPATAQQREELPDNALQDSLVRGKPHTNSAVVSPGVTFEPVGVGDGPPWGRKQLDETASSETATVLPQMQGDLATYSGSYTNAFPDSNGQQAEHGEPKRIRWSDEHGYALAQVCVVFVCLHFV